MLMRYKTLTKEIDDMLNAYKTHVDEYENQLIASQSMLDKRFENAKNSNQYNENYLKQLASDCEKDKKALAWDRYGALMAEEREKGHIIANQYFDYIENDINDFFGGDVSPSFASKVQGLLSANVKISNREFDILKGQAKSYFELRMLNQLAEHRTTQERHAKINDAGKIEVNDIESNDGYFGVPLPNIDGVYKDFQDYKSAVNMALDFYCGKEYKLNGAIGDHGNDKNGNKYESFVYMAGDSYFQKDRRNEFINKMDKLTASLPATERKTELSEQDKAFIDAIIDPRCPSLAKETVEKYSKLNYETAKLLSLDERYAKFVDRTATMYNH